MSNVQDIITNRKEPFNCKSCKIDLNIPEYPLYYAIIDHNKSRKDRDFGRVCVGCRNILLEFKFLSIKEYVETICT